jgi:hypothetical protein
MATIDAFSFPRCSARGCEQDSVSPAGGLFCEAHWRFVPGYLTRWLTREWRASPGRPTRAWLRLAHGAVELVERREAQDALARERELHLMAVH